MAAHVITSPDGAKLARANAQFALDLYRYISSATSSNVFLSPLNISMAMAMTYLGARNNTKSQMANVMHFDDLSDDVVHKWFGDVRKVLNEAGQMAQLFMANRLFGEKSYTFLDDYLIKSEDYYGAKLEPVDFRDDPKRAARTVNEWVADSTNGRIAEILPPGGASSQTSLVIASAVYFKGIWVHQFLPEMTEPQDFYISDDEVVQVQMMHVPEEDFQYGKSKKLHCQAVQLPYVGKKMSLFMSMFVLLPDRNETLASLESSLTAEDLVNIEDTFNMVPTAEEVNLWLPRFKLDEKLRLTEALSAMGMKDLFNEEAADLTGIGGVCDPRKLFSSEIFHRAVADVDEKGTEAAAATAADVAEGAIPHVDFRANRPFLFFVRDNNTKSILFLGRLVNPVN